MRLAIAVFLLAVIGLDLVCGASDGRLEYPAGATAVLLLVSTAVDRLWPTAATQGARETE